MSLETPDKIRNLQRKLYCKAKAEPVFRFYLLYDKICREDILRHAYALARANAGAPGVDGVTFAQIDAYGVDAWLAGVREEIVSKTYRPEPVRRVTIPKPGGGERPLGIPTIRDRVVETAAKFVLEPIFEADFEDSAYGYRPRRSAVDACKFPPRSCGDSRIRFVTLPEMGKVELSVKRNCRPSIKAAFTQLTGRAALNTKLKRVSIRPI